MNKNEKYQDYDAELIENDNFCQFLSENDISKEQYLKVKRLLKQASLDLKSTNPPTGINLEEDICIVCNKNKYDFHFAENMVIYFNEIGYCQDIFSKLYSHLPKYQTKDFD